MRCSWWRVGSLLAGVVAASSMLVVPTAAAPAGATGAAGPHVLPVRPAGRGAGFEPFSVHGSSYPATVAPDPMKPAPGPSPHVIGPSSTTFTSANWSGKVDLGTTFTAVEGEWVVPSVRPSSNLKMAAAWIGIAGFTTGQLIQTGTTSLTSTGTTEYFAWYELLPTAPFVLGTVAPGDLMSAEVVQKAPAVWTIEILDLTRDSSFEGTFAYTAGSADSAEWVVERPEFTTTTSPSFATLANFGTVRFSTMLVGWAGPTQPSTSSIAMIDTTATKILAFPGPTEPTTSGSFVDHYVSSPSVTGVSPDQGPASGGTAVTITGDYLVPGFVRQVTFGSASASFSVAANGSVVATAPPGSGTVDVRVTTYDGTSPVSGADTFTYVTTPPPPAPEPGYDLVGADGGVFVFPPPGTSGGYYGSLPGLGVTPAWPIVGMVPTVTDRGYFLVGADGGVFAFGTAPFLGSLPGIGAVPSQPITGIVAAAADRGYFLVGADGGVFAFGAVPYLGSLPGEHVSVDDVVGIAATPGGTGYWLVTATGTVYAFGRAQQLGTARGTPSPVSAIAGTPTGGGYWITTRSGAVYPFGNARSHGTLPALGVTPTLPIIGIVHATSTGGTGGYWLIGADGGVFAFGTVPFVGSLPGLSVHVSDVVGAVPTSSSA